jgi:hypothetical protein
MIERIPAQEVEGAVLQERKKDREESPMLATSSKNVTIKREKKREGNDEEELKIVDVIMSKDMILYSSTHFLSFSLAI